MSQSSYRTILRASSIIGGASFINIIMGLIKMKAAALFLGPAGVGLIGLYQNLIQTGSTVAGLGMNSAGTRRIAVAAQESNVSVNLARRALLWGALFQAVVGALLFWIFGDFIARHFIADPARTDEIAWLALGVALMVGAGAQTAILAGLRKTTAIAWVTIGNGLLGALGAIAVLWWFGDDGLLAFVLLTPIATFFLGQICVRRLAQPKYSAAVLLVAHEWGLMARMGIALMLSALVTLSGGLAVRVLVQRELGAEALGQFQAAWTIGMTYLAFVLGAMGTDFFPQLTAVINDKKSAGELVNQQTEVALLLCGPAIVLMLGCAPLVVQLLYTSEFSPAAEILRWQLIGDILKVISWPLGFILLASGAGNAFVLAESTGICVFVLTVAFGLPFLGVAATGPAFVALYAIYLPVVWWLGRDKIAFSWSGPVLRQAAVTLGAAVTVFFAAELSDLAGIVAGLALGVLLAAWSLVRIVSISGTLGVVGSFLGRVETKIESWLNRKRP